MRRRLPLAYQVLAMQLIVVVVAALTGLAAAVWQARQELDAQFEQRALAIAQSVASMQSIKDGLSGGDPGGGIQTTAERVRQATGASYVVVTDRSGIRYSHPNPARIGHPVDESPAVVLAGNTWVGVQSGTLGVAARGKAPIFDAGQVVGMVSVGYPESKVSERLLGTLPGYAVTILIALALGAVGSWLLAARLKRQTFGLEPFEIAGLLQEREATLQRISDGAVATGPDGRITVINDAARRLLGLDAGAVGRRPADVLPAGRLVAFLSGHLNDQDVIVIAGERVLVGSRRAVASGERDLGHVTTLRDAGELARLGPRLGVSGLTDALRAQAHEFSNRLHTIAGLVELGRAEDAIQLIEQTSAAQQELTEAIVERVGNPILAALLLAKAAVASERGVDLRIAEASLPSGTAHEPDDLITVVGNLIDNAVEAVAGSPGALVEVSVGERGSTLLIEVRDNGPGVPPALRRDVFREGFSTKGRAGARGRGFGLALVSATVQRLGGEIRVDGDQGAVFTVTLPANTRSAA